MPARLHPTNTPDVLATISLPSATVLQDPGYQIFGDLVTLLGQQGLVQVARAQPDGGVLALAVLEQLPGSHVPDNLRQDELITVKRMQEVKLVAGSDSWPGWL